MASEEEQVEDMFSKLAPEQLQQVAMMQVTKMMKEQKDLIKLSGKCYQQCSPGGPGKSLGSYEQKCLWRCAQRWTETGHFLTKYMISKSEESGSMR